MPERFVFRQVDYRDLSTFLEDGEMEKFGQKTIPINKHVIKPVTRT